VVALIRARDRAADLVDLVLAQLGEPHAELGEIQARHFLVVSLSCQPSWVAYSTGWHALVVDLDLECFGQACPSRRRELECTAARHTFEPSDLQ